jgi:hypothetical protein
MKLLVKLKSGEEGMVVGYAPGRKGSPLAIIAVENKLRAVKLRNLEIVGYAKIQAKRGETEPDQMISPENGSDLVFH